MEFEESIWFLAIEEERRDKDISHHSSFLRDKQHAVRLHLTLGLYSKRMSDQGNLRRLMKLEREKKKEALKNPTKSILKNKSSSTYHKQSATKRKREEKCDIADEDDEELKNFFDEVDEQEDVTDQATDQDFQNLMDSVDDTEENNITHSHQTEARSPTIDGTQPEEDSNNEKRRDDELHQTAYEARLAQMIKKSRTKRHGQKNVEVEDESAKLVGNGLVYQDEGDTSTSTNTNSTLTSRTSLGASSLKNIMKKSKKKKIAHFDSCEDDAYWSTF